MERHVFDATAPAAAPDLVNVEVLHALRRLERRRYVDADRIGEAVDDLAVLPIARYPTLDVLPRAWDLRQNFTPYDAVYVGLAEALGTAVVTADRHFATAARDHTSVEVVLLS